ncbi:hypothetical protein J1N35_042895 [Gossypium stocksii]|uniref:Uncharacterized protein n=1 Tax=Gossypium stocksii TaxID=47602 RepID=A0A9D3U6D0_9ROSI|nr:hypothetical protein J1N35_042895 [Gossypium stocksii]
MVFKRLSKNFDGFQAAYKLGNNTLTLIQLIKELQSYKLMLNGRKGKHAKKDKTKVSRRLQVERKRTKKPKDLSKSRCFFYSKKEHYKANYKEWKEYLAIKLKATDFLFTVMDFLVASLPGVQASHDDHRLTS